MKVAVIGSRGYIAQRVIAKLAQNGHEVVAFSTSGHQRLREIELVTYELADLRNQLVSSAPDVVINMTNHFTRSDTTEEVLAMADVNCALVTEIASACCDQNAILLHVGTAWETDDANPNQLSPDLYGLFRSLATTIINWHMRTRHLRVYQIRLYDTYGPGDPRNKVVQLLAGQIAATETLDMSKGDQILELVHVEDVATAFLLALEHLDYLVMRSWDFSIDYTYWCRPDEPITLRGLATIIEELSGKTLNVNWGARPYRPGEQFVRAENPRPQVPRWRPSIKIRDGLNQILNGYDSQNE